MEKSVKIGELEIPINYWELSDEDKRTLCLEIIDSILTILEHQVNPMIPRDIIMNKLLESSIISNLDEENYEICQVLTDIKSIFNE